MKVPTKISDQINSALRKMKPVIEQQKSRDVSESDTSTLVTDILSEALNYDKYVDITGEHAIRGTYCDLMIKIDDKPAIIVEVKAIGISLDDKHVKQAVDYAANQGIEWVVLTNAVNWRLYNVVFAKPIDKHLVCDVNLLDFEYRKSSDAECLYLFSKYAFKKGHPGKVLSRQIATSRYMLAALLTKNRRLLKIMRLELRRLANVNVDEKEIASMLEQEVLKRDTMDGQQFVDAVKLVNRKEVKKQSKAETIDNAVGEVQA